MGLDPSNSVHRSAIKMRFKVANVHDKRVTHPTLTFVLSLVRGSDQD